MTVRVDGLAVVEGLLGVRVQACMPPKVPVPKPGPCPKATTGIKKIAKAVRAKPALKHVAGKASPVSPRVAALPRTGRQQSAQVAAKATNPMFGLTATEASPVYREQGQAGQQWTPQLGPLPYGAYEYNCTNVVMAWELRMRGYDVQAAPLDELDKHGYAAGRTFTGVDDLIADAWRLPDGTPHGRTFYGRLPGQPNEPAQPWRSFDDIDAEIERDWPEGGRGVITTGKHIFSVIKTGGKARYIEAQYDATASRDVTTKYKRQFRASGAFGPTRQEGKLIRLDDLVPTDAIMQTVRTQEQTRDLADRHAQAVEALPRSRSMEDELQP